MSVRPARSASAQVMPEVHSLSSMSLGVPSSSMRLVGHCRLGEPGIGVETLQVIGVHGWVSRLSTKIVLRTVTSPPEIAAPKKAACASAS